MKQKLRDEIERFTPFTEEEAAAKAELLRLIDLHGVHILDRDCPDGHITCSGFIMSPELQETVMAYHLIYHSVGWTGGHADGCADLLGNALREAKEETSAVKIYPHSVRILSIDILPVPPHEKNGVPVEAHLHYNVSYGLIAEMDQTLAAKPDENREVVWLPVEEIGIHCTEAHMIPIYNKLVERMRAIEAERIAVYPRIAEPLLAWYEKNKRDLPWRRDRDPYHVWVSEIMLQQTRVEVVKDYYLRFIDEIPDYESLSFFTEDRLMNLWEGMGYYRRVFNMPKCAQQIMSEYNGRFPRKHKDVLNLIGVGEYTAGAICSICYGQPTPAIDGNVLRVMARLLEDFRNVLTNPFKMELSVMLGEVYKSVDDCGMLTQALIEIGATVCIPNGAPRCDVCPLADICVSRKSQSQQMLPIRKKYVKRRLEELTMFVFECDGKIAIRRRPSEGLLANMWELPWKTGHYSEQRAAVQAVAWDCHAYEIEKMVVRKHVFTHLEWDILGVFMKCRRPSKRFVWVTPEELEAEYSLPTAFRCVLD